MAWFELTLTGESNRESPEDLCLGIEAAHVVLKVFRKLMLLPRCTNVSAGLAQSWNLTINFKLSDDLRS